MRRLLLYAIVVACLPLFSCSSNDDLEKRIVALEAKGSAKFKFLQTKGIETRTVIGGNFVNQPSIKLYNFNSRNEDFPKAQEIENRGFFIGLHPKSITEDTLNYLEKNLLKIDKL